MIEEINKRREAYEQNRSKGTVYLVNAPKKPSAKASAKKRLEKKEKQRLQKEIEQKEIEQYEQRWEADRSGINMNGQSTLFISGCMSNHNSFCWLP